MNHVKCYQKGYPRPQFVRKSFVLLNGEWDFRFDFSGVGDSENYKSGFAPEYKINVPYAYQTERSGINRKDKCNVVWYQREVDFSALTENGKRAIINFEGVDYRSTLYVNGVYAGENVGAYHRFSIDVTDLLRDGKGLLVLRVYDDDSTRRPRGKQTWTKEPFGCWYFPTTGIFKDVWAESVSKSRIASVYTEPLFEEHGVRFTYDIAGYKQGLSLECSVFYEGALVAEGSVKLLRSQNSVSFDLKSEAVEWKVAYWYASDPKLYDVEFRLYDGGALIDEVGSYFGVRRYSTRNDTIIVNDFPRFMKMTLDQGYIAGGGLTETEDELLADVLFTKEIGLNGIRKHQKIEDERFYYFCDVVGIYAWLEMPSMYEFSDEGIENFTNEYIKVVNQNKNHPSIMAYVPFNESWGVHYICTDKRMQAFTRSICELTKALASDILTISNDGWEHTESDIVTVHNYASFGEGLMAAYGDMDRALACDKMSNVSNRFPFAEGYAYRGQPLLLSEFGGIALQTENGWGYGGMEKSEDDYFARLESLLCAIEKLPRFSGYCYTQTTDVEQEINGFMNAKHECKVDKKRLAEVIKKHNNF